MSRDTTYKLNTVLRTYSCQGCCQSWLRWWWQEPSLQAHPAWCWHSKCPAFGKCVSNWSCNPRCKGPHPHTQYSWPPDRRSWPLWCRPLREHWEKEGWCSILLGVIQMSSVTEWFWHVWRWCAMKCLSCRASNAHCRSESTSKNALHFMAFHDVKHLIFYLCIKKYIYICICVNLTCLSMSPWSLQMCWKLCQLTPLKSDYLADSENLEEVL